MAANRTTAERASAARRRLATEPNVWVATASEAGRPHLVPLSLAWDGVSILVATPTANPTSRNIAATGNARASLADADDVVILDTSATVTALGVLDDAVVATFVERTGWDPRDESSDWSMLTLTPRTVLAWNGISETDGRTIMADGVWLG